MFVFFLIVWVTDIGGYFAGRGIGGPKLWARVSPKKTWAGAIGGFVAESRRGVRICGVRSGQGRSAVAAGCGAVGSFAVRRSL